MRLKKLINGKSIEFIDVNCVLHGFEIFYDYTGKFNFSGNWKDNVELGKWLEFDDYIYYL